MTKPVRIQLSRAKGFNLRAASLAINGLEPVKVDRSSPFGNPYVASKDPIVRPAIWDVFQSAQYLVASLPTKAAAIDLSIKCFEQDVLKTGPHNPWPPAPVPTPADIVEALRGRNLACWCRLDMPCHADVLLRLANPDEVTHVQG